VFFLGLVVLAAAACRGERANKNVCPIDGSAPQWSGRRNGNYCEYSHYNAVERQTHSWWAVRDLTAPEKPKQI
jgi:hypothetical protein